MTTLLYKAGNKHEEFGIKCEIIRVNNPKEIADWIATGKVFFSPQECYPKEAESPVSEDATNVEDLDPKPARRGRPPSNKQE